MTFLLKLLGGGIPWKLLGVIGIAAGVAIGAVYFVRQVKLAGIYEAQRDTALAASAENARLAQWQAEESQRLQGIVAENAKEKAAQRRRYDQLRRSIADAPDTEDGPLAAVLRHTLDGLREPEGIGAGRAAPGPGGP